MTDKITFHRFVRIGSIADFEAVGWVAAPGGPLPAPHGLYAILMDWAGAGDPIEPPAATLEAEAPL